MWRHGRRPFLDARMPQECCFRIKIRQKPLDLEEVRIGKEMWCMINWWLVRNLDLQPNIFLDLLLLSWEIWVGIQSILPLMRLRILDIKKDVIFWRKDVQEEPLLVNSVIQLHSHKLHFVRPILWERQYAHRHHHWWPMDAGSTVLISAVQTPTQSMTAINLILNRSTALILFV